MKPPKEWPLRAVRWPSLRLGRRGGAAQGGDRLGEGGSILLFVLFVCLAVAVVAQSLSAVVLCAERSLGAESDGRAHMEEKDQALATLRQRALQDWRPAPWAVLRLSPEVQGMVADIPDSGGRALAVSARESPEVSPIVVSAWLERGRDGLDLPLAGLVAGAVTWTPGRVSPWLDTDSTGVDDTEHAGTMSVPTGRLWSLPADPLLGPGVTLGTIPGEWRLDAGWRSLFDSVALSLGEPPAPSGARQAEGIAPEARVFSIHGDPGTTVEIPQGWGAPADGPALLVVTGGARLDARGRGDVYGVIVVDEGNVLLDGTRLHGAMFASGRLDFGTSGAVVFCRSVLRWACDESLVRARLVPGTRSEAIQ